MRNGCARRSINRGLPRRKTGTNWGTAATAPRVPGMITPRLSGASSCGAAISRERVPGGTERGSESCRGSRRASVLASPNAAWSLGNQGSRELLPSRETSLPEGSYTEFHRSKVSRSVIFLAWHSGSAQSTSAKRRKPPTIPASKDRVPWLRSTSTQIPSFQKGRN